MGNLLHLHDPHEQTQRLLPWRVNGTLEASEAAQVEAHLAECADCRADLEDNIAMRAHIASMPTQAENRWPALQDRIAGAPRGARVVPFRALRRPVALGWALAAQAAVAATFALFFFAGPSAPPPAAEPAYRLLGSPAGAETANVIVLFAPDTTQRQLLASLQQAGGRVVDGPTASGAYMIQVAEDGRGEALDRLRDMPHVALAEPLDSGGAQ